MQSCAGRTNIKIKMCHDQSIVNQEYELQVLEETRYKQATLKIYIYNLEMRA